MSRIYDEKLKDAGLLKIDWVSKRMPVLTNLSEYLKGRFDGVKISMSIHLEAKTAYLAKVLKLSGAEVAICSSNPLTAQDDVTAGLASLGVNVFARRGESETEHEENIESTLAIGPDLVLDDGADLVVTMVRKHPNMKVLCATEETTSGLTRMRALAREGKLPCPVIAVNDAQSKYLFDNRYGTGQSSWDGIMRTTNLTVCGKTVVIAGYGWVGRGLAMRAKGLGARVVATEVNPIRAMEAYFDGCEVMEMKDAARIGDIFVTATGDINIIDRRHFDLLKDGAILCNAGHFDVEVSMAQLRNYAVSHREARNNIQEYILPSGKKIYVLGEGRLVNLVCADGHPAEIMDLSFSLQSLSLLYGLENGKSLAKEVVPVPQKVDIDVARLKLESVGVKIDQLTEEQVRYLASWE